MTNRLEVVGTGSYLPDTVIPNSYFTGRLLNKYGVDGGVVDRRELTDEGIVKITGIRERRVARPEQVPSDLGYLAAEKAIYDAGIDKQDIVAVVFSSVTEERNFPSAAAKVQKQLGIEDCFAYDVANACAGFPMALAQANALSRDFPGSYLVIGAETLWNMVDKDDINSTLFGEGAGAAVLSPTDSARGIFGSYLKSNPFEGRDMHIYRDNQRIMRMPEGDAVMRAAVRSMGDSVAALKEQVGWDCADLIIPHQANKRIIDKIAQRHKEKVFINIHKYGNMSTATTAVGLDEARAEGLIQEGSKVIVTSFGAGESTAAVAIQF